MKNCLDCERARLTEALSSCSQALVWSRSLDYEFHHKGDGHLYNPVPMRRVFDNKWFKPVCHFHKLHPGNLGLHTYETSTCGVYPDRQTFEREGLPMLREVRREVLLRFEDLAAEENARKKRRT
jgi:hypothetical protein